MKKSIFFEFCTVKTLEKQYPHYTGTEKWMIISDLSKVEKRERRMELQKALQLLTKKQQRRILMYYFGRKTEREIANILHVSKSAVHDSLAAGMKKLRDFYDGKEIFWDCF